MSDLSNAARVVAAASLDALGPQLEKALDEAELTAEVVRVRARELVRLQAEAAILRLAGDVEAATLVEAGICSSVSSLASLSASKASQLAVDVFTGALRRAAARI